jgi:CheY-like chemotaxis protein
MGGRDAVARLREMGIEVPVIAASGHAEDPVMASPREFGFVGSLAKPFTKTQLVALLEKL